jgi:NAD(P)-dependent dehydrogenase (short-subunit alcohol dehydrogenase family)
MTVKDRIALVTGGGSGIGRQVSLSLASSGAKVAVVDINNDNALKTVIEIREAGGDAIALQCDVSVKEECINSVESVIEKWGKIEILVNCAGILFDRSLSKLTEEAFDKVHKINLKGPMFFIQAAIEPMKKQQFGRILNLASGAYLGNHGQTAYSTSKAGVVSLTRVAALELARYGITVNCVAPGIVETPMTAGMPSEAYENLVKVIPLGRIGRPEDISHMILSLVADEASYTTGQTIFIDGGLTVGASRS